MKEKKKVILSVLGLILLVVLVVGITYAAFTYTKRGQVENTVRTGKITFEYTEGENGITLGNAYPVADSVGKKITDPNQVFDFTVSVNLYGNKLPVSYEVTGEKDENSTLNDEDIRIYLERSIDGASYSSVLEPSGYVPINSVDEFGASANEMMLDKGTTTDTVTYNYRLRMWVGESYKVTGEEKYFTMKVNVYGNDGVTVEVKGIELDKVSETLKLTNTLQLNAKTTPVSPTDSSITWTSSNPFVATVSDTGLVEAKGIGNAVITATSSNGKSSTANINVTADCMNSSTEGACIAGTRVAYKVNDTTAQNFYVLKDNGTTLTLITDKVVATSVAWDSSGSKLNGPRTATQALENVTKEWTNLSSSTYDETIGQATYTRIIKQEETEALGCENYTDNSCPIWISTDTHWTATTTDDRPNIGTVISSSKRALYPIQVNLTHYGVRAVVTISK